MVIGQVSTPPSIGGGNSFVLNKTMIIFIIILVLLAAAAFSIFGSGNDIISSSGGEGVGDSAGNDGGDGSIFSSNDEDDDSESDLDFDREMTLENGVVVKSRGLEIAESNMYIVTVGRDENGGPISEGRMLVNTVSISQLMPAGKYKEPFVFLDVLVKKKDLEKISFSVHGVSVNNLEVIEENGMTTLSAYLIIPENTMMTMASSLYDKNWQILAARNSREYKDEVMYGSWKERMEGRYVISHYETRHWDKTKYFLFDPYVTKYK